MGTPQQIHIGILSPATADRPHFKSLEQMLPPEVTITNEGLGLLQDSYHDLEGKTDEVAARSADFVGRTKVLGLIVTGGFVTLFNPGLEAKVAESVHIPVTSAVSSVTAALKALSATRVMLVTPFTSDMNAVKNICIASASRSSRAHPMTRPANQEPASRSAPTSFFAE